MVIQKLKCRFGVLLNRERDIKPGLRQREAKEFALAGAVVDQEDGVMRHHYREEYQQGLCRVMVRLSDCYKDLKKQVVM